MAIPRKVSSYRLTISGLPEGTGYAEYLSQIRSGVTDTKKIAFEIGARTRILAFVTVLNDILRMRFLSFKSGHRPDVIDMSNFQVVPNPAAADHVPVEWTHAVGRRTGRGFILLIETFEGGISGLQIEEYLQRLINQETDSESKPRADRITVNIEPIPSSDFVNDIDSLDQITSATLTVVQPNPGWSDDESALAVLATNSDAKKLDLTLFARTGDSLDPKDGIVGVIREKFKEGTLAAAKILGIKDGIAKRFSTRTRAKTQNVTVKLDPATGQVDDEDAWQNMSNLLKNTD